MVIKRLLVKLSLEQSKTPHPRFAYEFYLKSRHLFNFIERTCLSKLKQQADYDTICIDARYGFDAPYMERSAELVYPGVLTIILPFDLAGYRSLTTMADYYDFIERVLVEGFAIAGDRFALPQHDVLESFRQFRSEGCENTWSIVSKVIDKERKLKVQLRGRLTADSFSLEYSLLQGKALVDAQVVFVGEPDELIFAKIVQALYVDQGELVIQGKRGVLKRLPLPASEGL